MSVGPKHIDPPCKPAGGQTSRWLVFSNGWFGVIVIIATPQVAQAL